MYSWISNHSKQSINFNKNISFQSTTNNSFKMKVTAIICTLMAAATTVTASAVFERKVLDTCGSGYGSDQRRTNSPCEASNGDRDFCGCDRTDVVC